MTFSRRTRVSSTDTANALSRAVARAPAPLLDLTVSNPTTAGLPYERDAITRAFASAEALVYEPAALGHPLARRAVAELYSSDPARVAITASTSEAYAALFKTFCDPGDEVLVPVPSYPLLAWLAAFEGITLRPYSLAYAGGWHVDLGAIEPSERTRAIVVVSPNNPTGSFLKQGELDALLDLDLPIVCDEVFATYPLRDPAPAKLRVDRGLFFSLSGLSKLVGLPQMKLGWIAASGDARLVEATMERLETVLDAYLSVGAPVQHALPELLRAGETTARAIRARIRTNLETVRDATSGAMTLLDVEGGWYATLRVPETRSDEAWCVRLVEADAVHVQPGYFFDMARGAHLVVSLLTPEDVLREGMRRIAARIESEC